MFKIQKPDLSTKAYQNQVLRSSTDSNHSSKKHKTNIKSADLNGLLIPYNIQGLSSLVCLLLWNLLGQTSLS